MEAFVEIHDNLLYYLVALFIIILLIIADIRQNIDSSILYINEKYSTVIQWGFTIILGFI